MRLWMALLGVLGACGFGNGDAVDAGPGDTGVVPDASTCFGSYAKVCLSALPSAALSLADELDLDTSANGAMCDPGVTPYCVVARTSFTIASTGKIRAHGTRPLVLVSTTDAMFDLAGEIDVSSKRAGTNPAGAGANASNPCPGTTSATLTGGGFGGSFGGSGSDGSDGNSNAGSKGIAGTTSGFPTALRGGCPGGDGSPVAIGNGNGGLGGGAVAIIAPSAKLNGKINASGAGGAGGAAVKAGGGGGGSGGMIFLDTPTLTMGPGISLYASGGGGGQGGTLGVTNEGANGSEPSEPNTGAPGGAADKEGGTGGVGSSGSSKKDGGPAGPAGPQSGGGGGGGGGGGAGFIHAAGISGSTIIAPPSLDPPAS